jgi:hypothetical protein
MDRISWKSTSRLALAAIVCLLAAPASAGITYNITNDLTHQNGWSLAGTITLSGTGTFFDPNGITAWDFTASKTGSESRRYSNTSSSAGNPKMLSGTLNATSTTLSLAAASYLSLRETGNGAEIAWDSGTGFGPVYSADWVNFSSLWISNVNTSSAPFFSPVVDGAWVLGTATPSAVPEIDPAGIGSVLALVTGALGLLERRRLKTA